MGGNQLTGGGYATTIKTESGYRPDSNFIIESIPHESKYEYAGVGVHPVSKKLEFDGYKDRNCPTLLATDWKCPKTILEKEKREIKNENDITTNGTVEKSTEST